MLRANDAIDRSDKMCYMILVHFLALKPKEVLYRVFEDLKILYNLMIPKLLWMCSRFESWLCCSFTHKTYILSAFHCFCSYWGVCSSCFWSLACKGSCLWFSRTYNALSRIPSLSSDSARMQVWISDLRAVIFCHTLQECNAAVFACKQFGDD